MKLKMKEKLAFGMGDFGGNFCFSFLSSFALIYFTDIAGANVKAVATLLALAKCFDGITDVIMGNLIDNTHSKMGKARPWLFWSAFPLAIALIMLFNVPSSLSEVGKNIYIFIVYVLICAFFYTANNISYNALTSLITDDPDERVGMSSIRFMFTAVAGIVIGSFTTVLIKAFGTGQKGWTMVSVLYAVIFLVSTLITVFGVKERVMPAAPDQKKRTPFLKSLGTLLTNRYFIIILLIFIVLYIYTGSTSTAGIYYATYVLGNADIYGLLAIAMMVPMFISLMFAPKLTEKMGMQKVCLVGAVLFAAGSLVTAVSGGNMLVLIVGIVIRSIGMGPLSASLFPFVAAVGENVIKKSGKSVEGMVYSSSSVGMKIGTGLGTAIVGWLMDAGGYVGTLEVQSASALGMIKASYLYMPIILGIVAFVLFACMNVEKDNKKLRGGE